MNEIKIEDFPVLSGEVGLKPKDRPLWAYRALDIKTDRYLWVIVDSEKKPDEKTEKKIYAHILDTFKKDKIWREK